MDFIFRGNIDEKVLANTQYKKILYENPFITLEAVNLEPESNIGVETHTDETQIVKVVRGEGKAIVDGVESILEEGSMVIIPSQTSHDIINTSSLEELKMYFIYVKSDMDRKFWDEALNEKHTNKRMANIPTELYSEIMKNRSTKEFLNLCRSNKSFLKKCLTINHWDGHIRGIDISDFVLIIQFVAKYMQEYPHVYKYLAGKFIDRYKYYIIAKELNSPMKTRILKKYNCSSIDEFYKIYDVNPEQLKRDDPEIKKFENTFNVVLNFNSSWIPEYKTKKPFVYSEEKYGRLKDLQRTKMYKGFAAANDVRVIFEKLTSNYLNTHPIYEFIEQLFYTKSQEFTTQMFLDIADLLRDAMIETVEKGYDEHHDEILIKHIYNNINKRIPDDETKSVVFEKFATTFPGVKLVKKPQDDEDE